MSLSKKHDFAVIFKVKNANPNGDPLNGNRPRTTYEGFGEVSDVCLKRKIRNRLMQSGESILIQSDDSKMDDCKSIRSRIDAAKLDPKDPKFKQNACAKWYDVRAFGQVFAMKAKGAGDGVSVPVRGPVSIHPAFSVEPVAISSTQITKSVNAEDSDKGKKSSDTMGMKHRVDEGIYVFYGSLNPQLSSDETGTGFSDADAVKLKKTLAQLFENDASSARPEGSMEVLKVIWWEHNSLHGQYSSAKVHKSITVNPDGSVDFNNLDGLAPEQIDGF
jgi:CRISPR-associated protein Csd2